MPAEVPSSLLDKIERVPLDQLTTHPENPRRGDVGVIAQSLQANAQYAPIVVQRSTSYVLAGNHTLLAARSLNWADIAAVFVDVDNVHARRILISSNRTAEYGSYDDQALAEVLAGLNGDWGGTGWDADDYDDLLSALGKLPVLPPQPTQAAYAETPEQLAEREERFAGAQPKAALGIREMVLVVMQDDYDELQSHITLVRRTRRADLTASEAVLDAMRAVSRLIDACTTEDACAWCAP